MNHIRRLQRDLADAQAKLSAVLAETESFRQHLHLPKFITEEQGDRKDWIATRDVLNRLSHIRDAANGIA